MNIIRKILFLPDYLNGYGMSDPNRNGEYRFLRKYIENNMIVFDVGANIGDYTEFLLDHFEQLELHAFEPVNETFAEMKNRIPFHLKKSRIYLNNFGLSDKKEEREIFIYGQFAGVNSLYLLPDNTNIRVKDTATINLDTLDTYVIKTSVKRIDLLKIDVEGHELKVLQGSLNTLRSGMIKSIQFEYGGSFKNSDSKLEDIFNLLMSSNFFIYRLKPFGLKRIKSFKPELENYKHSNWIAINENVG